MRNLLMFTSLNTNMYPFHFKSYTILREKKIAKETQPWTCNFTRSFLLFIHMAKAANSMNRSPLQHQTNYFQIDCCWFQVSKSAQLHFWNSMKTTESFSCRDLVKLISSEHFILVESACNNVYANTTTEKKPLSPSPEPQATPGKDSSELSAP